MVSVTRDSEPERVLTPATTATSASYSLTAGSSYAFTVAALSADGAQLAASAPWTVSLRQAPARISLTAMLPRGAASRRVELAARLSVAGLPGAEGARTVVLESFDGTRWSRAAAAVTDAAGRATWHYPLTAGSYRIRARYPGTDQIAPATSAPVRITLR
jgi:hypothetical protein